ncbi:hypothetical protein CAOG_01282 [Capsaspora owczarzaki ATCC 30864]|uniref:Transketolase-like pyrimidine-binding domain-containing protein n=1 Tax=Capsaspora owczarzaki (strain ATCC 30864) TaxID=595528 RepID=A0A0D2U3T4_CAPO3|nr:hypothetical protein CAOG_01282 [Capsaspora owczarzaki ATCC 30864]KJE89866.1 hypothetical protein CAOG_001282 [Capsaspora owczarzaki ATCC 30864]|eukprot:XP_004349802.1 hypothetical protein CAOG_01282 [Capsaspora owczarzaki ATCC 30864]
MALRAARWLVVGAAFGLLAAFALPADAARSAAANAVALHQLIGAFRDTGHLAASTDPLQYAKAVGTRPASLPQLDYHTYGFTDADLDVAFDLGEELFGTSSDTMTLRQLVSNLNQTYCGHIGFEYGHVVDADRRQWLVEQIETLAARVPSTVSWSDMLGFLVEADTFANFVNETWPDDWTFPMSGLNNQLTAIKSLIRAASANGIQAIHFGMHHRGRDEFMHNVMQIPLPAVFHYMDDDDASPGHPICSAEGVCYSGDSIYGMGTSAWLEMPNNKSIWVSVASNSAHLDSNNPIVAGSAGAVMDMMNDTVGEFVLPVLISGDGAVSAQGIVEETKLLTNHIHGYQTGGFLHLVNNNQIAHTVDPAVTRVVPYPTDFAKVIDGPVFHVNGDDPESVAWVVELAMRFRQQFHVDVVIDVIGYRRQGHYGNPQADHPLWSNPQLYDFIAHHPTELAVYSNTLIQRGVITQDAIDGLVDDEHTRLYNGWVNRTQYPVEDIGQEYIWPFLEAPWPKLLAPSFAANLSASVVSTIGRTILFDAIPANIQLTPDLAQLLTLRQQQFDSGQVGWAVAEALAIGSLLNEGFDVRMTGQDTILGIALVRAMELFDRNTFTSYRPLDQIRTMINPAAGRFRLFDSSLSELAVLGYELGYSIQRGDDTLVLWDMHNADFINNAQMMVDQYIAEGEVKWFRQTPLTLILPMGYEACNGPEHSNVRMARLLLTTDGSAVYWNRTRTMYGDMMAVNIIVIYPTTPANYFHAIRRQMHFNNLAGYALRKPLFLPLGLRLLKNDHLTSDMSEFATDTFMPVIGETDGRIVHASQVQRIMFCSGQIISALNISRVHRNRWDVAIVRLEQLSPFPFQLVHDQVEMYPNADVMWVQEDPRNMGAWFHFQPRFAVLYPGRPLLYAGRNTSAAAATGFCRLSQAEEQLLLNDAFDLPKAIWLQPSDAPLSTASWVGIVVGTGVVMLVVGAVAALYIIARINRRNRSERLLVN